MSRRVDLRGPFLGHPTLVVGAGFTLAAGLLTWFAIAGTDAVFGHAVRGPDLRPLVLCLGLVGLSVSTYAAWPSRWNVLAHTNLVFSLVAYVIPIFALHRLASLSSFALDTYYRVIALGLVCCLLGTVLGASLASPALARRIRTSRDLTGHAGVLVGRRVLVLTAVSAVAVLACFAYLGFIPAFAADPLLAKFFKGAYAARYGAVSVPYRFGTSVLALLLPLSAYYGLRRRASGWARTTFALATVVLLFGLLRQPALAGTLILIGAALAVRRRGLVLYFSLLVAAYLSGAALYSVLSLVGLTGFAASASGSGVSFDGGFLTQVALGAPDLTDQITFLQSWLARPEYTHGATFVGGLVPGNFYWNPAVWSLHVTNPEVAVRDIGSGGLRLPAPLWGLVSFGWPGLVGVSFCYGFLSGFLARLFSRIVPDPALPVATLWLVLYVALNNVIAQFFALAYLSVIQLVVIGGVIFWHTRAPAGRGDGNASPSDPDSPSDDRPHTLDGVAPAPARIAPLRR